MVRIPRLRLSSLSCCAALLLLAPAALRGDWLVAKDGSRIETKGAWTVKNNLVLFTQPNGTFSSLRLAAVDLDASAAATAKAKEPVAPTETSQARRPAVLVLTEKDLPPVPEAGEEAEGQGKDAKSNAPAEQMAVTGWDRVNLPDAAGVQVTGTVINQGKSIATGGTVLVSLFDEAGAMLVTSQAELSGKPISPGQGESFTVDFPGVTDFATAKFAVSSRGFRLMEDAPQAGETPEGAVPDESAPPEGEASAPH